MAIEAGPTQEVKRVTEVNYRGGSPDAVYGMGVIGAWVYYIGRANSFQEGAIGFAKGLFWPAFMVYEVLRFLEKK
jgi:hypothetical protein